MGGGTVATAEARAADTRGEAAVPAQETTAGIREDVAAAKSHVDRPLRVSTETKDDVAVTELLPPPEAPKPVEQSRTCLSESIRQMAIQTCRGSVRDEAVEDPCDDHARGRFPIPRAWPALRQGCDALQPSARRCGSYSQQLISPSPFQGRVSIPFKIPLS